MCVCGEGICGDGVEVGVCGNGMQVWECGMVCRCASVYGMVMWGWCSGDDVQVGVYGDGVQVCVCGMVCRCVYEGMVLRYVYVGDGVQEGMVWFR